VGKAHSATVNDVFMTGLLGGLRTYQERMGGPVVDLPIAFPINIAVDTSHDSGNHFSAGVIPGPCSVQDPVERLQAVHGYVAARRAEPGARPRSFRNAPPSTRRAATPPNRRAPTPGRSLTPAIVVPPGTT